MSLASYRAAPPRASRKRKRHRGLCRVQALYSSHFMKSSRETELKAKHCRQLREVNNWQGAFSLGEWPSWSLLRGRAARASSRGNFH